MVQDGFVANLDDPRFKEVLKAMIMLLTLPTVSSKTETMKKILKERSARNKDKKNKKNSSKMPPRIQNVVDRN